MNRLSRNPNEAGVALVTAMVFVSVALIALSALSLRAVNQNNAVNQYTQFKETFLGVEAALAHSIAEIDLNTGDGNIGLGTWAPTGASSIPSMDSNKVAPVQMVGSPNVTYIAHALDWWTDGDDNNGDGVIDDDEERWMYSITAMARYNDALERRVEAVIEGVDVNVWNNAIFGGAGQAGGLVSGNVSIHGSVHLLGTNIIPGNQAVSAIAMAGTSLIHNNYDGMPANLASRVPTLGTTEFNGETVETLNAKVRVRNGLVGMDGTSEIGSADVVGNALKETMDGTFVNDGWTGDAVVDDGDRGDPNHVYSDNGWDEKYDLGDRVPLPVLSDDWQDPTTGATTNNPLTGTSYSHAQYFSQQLSDAAYIGDMTIDATTDFYFNGSRPLDLDPANRQPGDDYIYFNATTNVMEINGQIEVTGDLNITSSKGNDKTIHYTGRAAILVHDDVSLDTSLLAQNSDGTIANSFPAANCLGIMAGDEMAVGTTSQLELMGAFYAQNQVSATKQSTIIGTFVSNYFDMGTDVPDIYQVPSLPQNLPLGMIGAFPILIWDTVSWREI